MDNELVEGVKPPQNIADLHKTLMNAYGEHLVPNLDFFSKKIVSDSNYAEGVRKNLIKVQGEDNVPDTKTFYDNLKKKDGPVSSPSSVIPSTSSVQQTQVSSQNDYTLADGTKMSNVVPQQSQQQDNGGTDEIKSVDKINGLKQKINAYGDIISKSSFNDDDKRELRRLNGELGANLGSIATRGQNPLDQEGYNNSIKNYNATSDKINALLSKKGGLNAEQIADYKNIVTNYNGEVNKINDYNKSNIDTDPIALAKQAKGLSNSTKKQQIQGLGGSVFEINVPDAEKISQSNKIKADLKSKGFDEDFIDEVSGIPKSVENQEGYTNKDLLELYQNNPTQFHRAISSAKWQSSLKDAMVQAQNDIQADNSLTEQEKNIKKNNIKSDLSQMISGQLGTLENGQLKGSEYQQQETENAINLVRKYVNNQKDQDDIIKNLVTDRSISFGSDEAYAKNTNYPIMGLAPEQSLGLDFLKKTNQRQFLGFQKYLNVDQKEVAKDYETKLGNDEKLKQLDEIGNTLLFQQAKEKVDGLISLGNKQQLTTEQQGILSHYQEKMNQAKQNLDNLDIKYPELAKYSNYNIAQELVGQLKTGFDYTKAGLGVSTLNVGKNIYNLVASPFRNETEQTMAELNALGQTTEMEPLTYQTQSNRGIQDFKYVLTKDLQDKIDKIKNSDYSQEVKLAMASKLIGENKDKISTVSLNGKFNIGVNSLYYGVSKLATDLAPYILAESLTGGGATAGIARKFASTFSSVLITSLNDEIAKAVKNNDPNPQLSAYTNIGINAIAFTVGGIPDKIKAAAGEKTAMGQMINRLTDDEILKVLRRPPASLRGFMEKAGEGLKSTVKESTISALKMQPILGASQLIQGADFDDKFLKEQALNVLNFSIFGTLTGAMTGINKFNDATKESLYLAGKHSNEALEILDNKIKDGNISKVDADQIRSNIEKAKKVYENVPMVNGKGKPLGDSDAKELLFLKMQEADLEDNLKKDIPKELTTSILKRLSDVQDNIDKVYKGTLIEEQKGVSKKLTKEADYLLQSLDKGKYPEFIDRNLKSIAEENGIKGIEEGKTTVGQVIEALKEKKETGKLEISIDLKEEVKPTKELEIPTDLEERGEQIESTLEAERRRSNGERIFAMSEQDEMPTEVTSIEMLRSYTPDQLIAYKPKEEPFTEHQEIGKAILSHVGINPSPEATKVYDATNLNTIDTEGYDDTQKKVLGDVSNVVKSITKLVDKSTGQKLTVTVHASPKSYAEAVARSGGDIQSARSKGFYLGTNGEIHLNMAKVTPETLLHEGFHPILDYMAKHNPEIIDTLHSQLAELKGGQDIIDNAIENYDGDITQKKEAITDYIAKVANGDIVLDRTSFQKVKDWIINALKELGIPIDKSIESIKDIQDLAKTISEKFAKGEEVKANNLFRTTETKSELQHQKGDELKPEDKDYISAKKILKEDREKFKKNPEAVTPEPQTIGKDENKKIKVEVVEGDNGKRDVKVVYKNVPYDLEKGALKYVSKVKSKAIDILANKLVEDYNANKNKPEISAAIGWYGNMRQWFQKNFGANIEVFGQLLAATSARTEVVDNFKQAVEAMRNLAKGKYDDILKDYDAHVKKIKSLSNEELKTQWQEKNPSKKLSLFDADDYRRFLINQYEDVPLRSNGKKFNTNSKKVLQALYGNWIEQTEGPKTKNFAGNLTGRSFDATIDVWAARYLRRKIFEGKTKEWRILPQSETGVQFGKTKAGEMTGDYPFAEEVMRKAADKLGIKADDLQAFLWYLEKDVWDKNNWTNTTGKKKASFEDTASSIQADRYQAGVTTFREDNFDSIKFEKERKSIQDEIGKIDGIMTSRVTSSEGEFISTDGTFTEPTFDIEFTVEKGTNISNVINKVHEIQSKYSQDATIISRFVDENHPNARPIIEVGLATPIEKSEIIDDIKKTLADMDVRGFTTAKDAHGKILGIRSQFVPEFENGTTMKEGFDRFLKAFDKINEKYGNYKEISYLSTGFVDSLIKQKENGTIENELDGKSSNGEQSIQGEVSKQATGEGKDNGNLREKQGGQYEGFGNREANGMAGQSETSVNGPEFSKDNAGDKKLQSAIDAQREAGISEEGIRKGLESVKEDLGITDEDIDRLMTPKAEPIKEEIPTAKKWSGTLISKAGLQASDYPFSKDFDVRGGQEVATDMLSRIKSQATRNDISLASQLRRKVESMKGTNPHPTEYNIISAGTHLLNIDKQIETAIENGQNIDNLIQERNETAAVLRKLGNNAGRNLGLFNLIFHEANSSEIKVTVNSIKRTLDIKNIAESVAELDSQLKRGEINPIDYEKVKPYVEKIEKYKADLDVAEKTFEDRAKEFRKESEEAALKEAFEKGREDVLNSRRPVLERKGNKDLANRLRGLKINKGGEEAPKLDTGTAQFSKDATTPKEEIWAKRINDIAAIVEGEKSIKDAISQLISEGKLKESDRVGIEQMIYKNILAEDATEKLKGFATAGETIITDAMVKEGVIKDIVEGVLHSGTSYDKVLDEATKLLQEQLPNVTRGMVSDAYIRKGEFKQETKGNLNKDIVEKRQALRRLDAKEARISALEDAAKFHTAANKNEKKKLLSEKEKEYDDKINKLNKDKKDAEKFYGESDATHRRINALEDELENLKNNIRKTVDPARVKALSDREIDVKKKISEEKKRLNTAEKEAGTFYGESNAKSERIQSLKDEIEDLENGIRKKGKTLNKTEYTGEEKDLVEKRDKLRRDLAKEERAANRFYKESESGNIHLEKMAQELDRLINREEKEDDPVKHKEISERRRTLQQKITAERLAWDKEKKLKAIEDEIHSVQSSKQVYRKAIKDKKETSSALNAAKEELEKTYSEAGLRRETKELQPIKIEQDYQAEVDKVNNNSSLSADEKKATIEELKDAKNAKLVGTKQGVVSLLSDALENVRQGFLDKIMKGVGSLVDENGEYKDAERMKKDEEDFLYYDEKIKKPLQDILSTLDPNGENIDDITRKAYGMLNDLLKNKSLSEEDRTAIEKIKSDFENNSMLTANEMNAKRLKAQWEAEIRSNQTKINSGNFAEMPENEYDFRTNDELVRLNAERMKFSGRLKALANEAKEKNKSLVDKSLDVSSKALVSGIHTAAKVLEAGSFKPVMDSIVELSMGNLVGKFITQTNATTLRGAGEGVRALAAYRTRESALKHIEILKDKRSEALKQFSKAVNNNLSESEIAKAKKQFEKADLSYAISTMYRSIDANSLKTFKDYVFHSSTEYDEMMGKGSKKYLSDYTTKLEKTGYILDGWVRIHGAMKTSLSARQAMMRSFSSTLAEFQKEGRPLNEDNISLAMIIAHNSYEEGRLTNKTAVSKLVTGWKNAENPYGRATANIIFPVSTIAFNIAKRGIDYSTFGVEGWTRLAMEAKKGMKLNAAEGREYDGFWEAVRGGISRIPLEERKYITGAISRGLFGTALGLITLSGLATGNIKYGGTFDDQRKRQIMGSDEEPLGPNEWEFFGHRMGKAGNAFLNHLPEFMPMALAANHYQINKLGGDFSDKIQTDLQEVEARLPFQTFLGLAQTGKREKTIVDRFTRFPLGAELGGYLDKNADLRDKSNTLNRIKSNVGLGYLNPSKEQQKQLDLVEKNVAEAKAEAKTKAELDQIEKEAEIDRKEILSQPIQKEE
jgi:hypothetical protein